LDWQLIKLMLQLSLAMLTLQTIKWLLGSCEALSMAILDEK
jgi:hypothetical protein